MENKKLTVVGLGEILWDMFPDHRSFGGAPANFACTAAGLTRGDLRVAMVSGVGDDELGRAALTQLQKHNVDTDFVQVPGRPTGTVQVELDGKGQATYSFADDVAWDSLRMTDANQKLASRTDAVCFGTLAQRSRQSAEAIQAFLAATPKSALRIFDINLRPPHFTDQSIAESLQLANILKLNEGELPYVADMLGICGSPSEQLKQIRARFELNLIVFTEGNIGATIVDEKDVIKIPGIPVEVVDSVGAGDAFTAAMTIGLLHGHDLPRIGQHAAQVAAFVCTQSGATPSLPDELAVSGST